MKQTGLQSLLERIAGHKRRNFLLDNDFSPAYSHFVKKDRPRAPKDRLQLFSDFSARLNFHGFQTFLFAVLIPAIAPCPGGTA